MVRGMPVSWFRQHLRALADCGIRLAPEVTVQDVKREFDQNSFVPIEEIRDSLVWDDCWLAFRLGEEKIKLELFESWRSDADPEVAEAADRLVEELQR